MLCQNCGKKEVNVRYTQIINGVKKQLNLCDECARKLGIGDFSFKMPSMSLSNLIDDMFSRNIGDLFTGFISPKSSLLFTNPFTFNNYQDLIEERVFEDEKNHQIFEKEMDDLFKKINKNSSKNDIISNNKQKIEEIDNNKENKERNAQTKLQQLQNRLQKEIREERYEDAAITRDEIKKIDNK